MRKSIFITFAIIIAFAACNTKQTAETTTTTEQSDQLYACPMHPEVTGKKGEKCSKCGMELTDLVKSETVVQPTIEPATKAETTTTIEQSVQLYACPMHPEIKGKKGDKCSKCGMELTEPVIAK